MSASTAQPRGPLDGVTVVDLSRVLAGPYCTMLLADLGADVIKVERPDQGDETRSWGPPYVADQSAYFLSVNRGKRSVALDLADPRGHDALLRLVDAADVFIENFRAGVAERLGVGFAEIVRRRPEIVYCSITAFGSRRDPLDRAGYDVIMQAESGLMSITGPVDGDPTKVGVAIVDVVAGLHAASAVIAALFERQRTGTGKHVEVSLLNAALAGLVNVAQAALSTDHDAGRFGNAHPSIVPYQPFRASDGWIVVAAANDALWRRLSQAIARPELANDNRFATNERRVRARDELGRLLAQTFAARPTDYWIERLGQAGVPVGKIRGVRDAFAAAASAGEAATYELEHATVGRLMSVRNPVRLDFEVVGAIAPPPRLGEHTVEVLQAAGLDAAALLEAGVAAQLAREGS